MDDPAPSQAKRLVALRLESTTELARAVEAAWAAGDAVLPIDAALPERAVARLLDELRPHVVITASGQRLLPDPGAVDADVSLVAATSGSRGSPKGVELTRAALEASAAASLARVGFEPATDRWLLCLPGVHVAGVAVLVRSRLAGVPPLIHDRFEVGAVATADATHVSLVPTVLVRLLDAGVDLRRFRCILLGGAAPPPGLLDAALTVGARVVVTYGMTETCGGCVYDGEPLDGVEVRLGADGRVAIRGPVLMRGYRGRPDLTADVLRDGWLLTADLGRWAPDGRLEVLGRADDVIVTGGVNVHAERVADLLRDHPRVAAAAVAGRPDREWGERVVAWCVPADPARPPDLDDLRRFVTDRAGPAAAPRELVVVEALPTSALGKPRAPA